MRAARLYLAATAALALLLAALVLRGAPGIAARHERARSLAAALGLTDLAVWTEARYTRHPSQADFFSPFQDAPGAPEHFPAGAVMSPAPGLRAGGGPLLARPRGGGGQR